MAISDMFFQSYKLKNSLVPSPVSSIPTLVALVDIVHLTHRLYSCHAAHLLMDQGDMATKNKQE